MATVINLEFAGKSFEAFAFAFNSLGIQPQFNNKYAVDFVTDISRVLDILEISHDKQWLQDSIAQNCLKVSQIKQSLSGADANTSNSVDANTLHAVLLTLRALSKSRQTRDKLQDFSDYFQAQVQAYLAIDINTKAAQLATAYDETISNQIHDINVNNTTTNTQISTIATNTQSMTDNDAEISRIQKEVDAQQTVLDSLQSLIDAQDQRKTQQKTQSDNNVIELERQRLKKIDNATQYDESVAGVIAKTKQFNDNTTQITQQRHDNDQAIADNAALSIILNGKNQEITDNIAELARQQTTIPANDKQISDNRETVATKYQSTMTNASNSNPPINTLPAAANTTEVTIMIRDMQTLTAAKNILRQQAQYNATVHGLTLSFFNCLLSSYFIPSITMALTPCALFYLDLTLSGNPLSFSRDAQGYYTIASSTTEASFQALGAAIGAQTFLRSLALGLSDMYLSSVSMDGLTTQLGNINALETLILDMRRSKKDNNAVQALVTNLKKIKNSLQTVAIAVEIELGVMNNDYLSAFSSQTKITSLSFSAANIDSVNVMLQNNLYVATAFPQLQKIYLEFGIGGTGVNFDATKLNAFVNAMSLLSLTELSLIVSYGAIYSFVRGMDGLPEQLLKQKQLTKFEYAVGTTLSQFQGFFAAFPQLTNLVTLVFGDQDTLTQDQLDSMGNSLGLMPQLQRLHLNLRLTRLDMKAFSSGLARMTNLQYLYIQQVNLLLAAHQPYYDALRMLASLTEFSSQLKFDSGSLQTTPLAYDGLTQCPKLQKLSLSVDVVTGNPTVQDVTNYNAMIINIISNLGSILTQLNINCRFGSRAIDFTLAQKQAFSNLSAMQYLNFSYDQTKQLADNLVQYMVNALDIQKIFCYCGGSSASGDDVIATIAQLSKFKKLQSYTCNSMASSQQGNLGQLLDAYQVSSCLRELSMASTSLGDGYSIGNVIQRSPNLQALRSGMTVQMRAPEIQHFCVALQQCNLKSLQFSVEFDSSVPMVVRLMLTSVFRANKNLSFLQLSVSSAETDEFFVPLFQSLKYCVLLQQFQLDFSNASTLTALAHTTLLDTLQNHDKHLTFTYLKISFPSMDANSKANYQNYRSQFRLSYSFFFR